MGWSNMYIKLNKDSKEYCPIEKIEEFVDHHNNFTSKFSSDELNEIDKTDEYPGEELNLRVLIQDIGGKKIYWAYLGNHGGIGHTFGWKNKYFPDITLYDSGNFEYYGGDWQSWPLISVEEYKEMVC